MSAIDLKSIEQQALKEINEEVTKRAKEALVSQMRRVQSARDVLRAEELKLEDLKARISEGSF